MTVTLTTKEGDAVHPAPLRPPVMLGGSGGWRKKVEESRGETRRAENLPQSSAKLGHTRR